MTTPQHERDAMICRACGNEERASEGYPCRDCGTFICVICNMQGVTQCTACAAKGGASPTPPPTPPPMPPAPPTAQG
ncbi:MAG TPA: hypothetical protein VFV33_10345 [Gemmatimonadaceae bacterium]|nr:hypothetical protein [Gemmatimonadaceae bacterium]